MTDSPRRDTLLKALRGRSFRRAMRAIAELRAGRDPTLADIIAGFRASDDQRSTQYLLARIVLSHGVRGLVNEWTTLTDPMWRTELVSEIEQALDLWTDEATVDLILTALEDPSRDVRMKAVWGLVAIVRDIPARDRRAARADASRRAIAARDSLRGWLTPARRSRASRGLVAMLEQHRQEPYVNLPQIVEALGYAAEPDDVDARQALESLRSQSGEAFHVSYETVDPTTLDWRERLLAERKGIAPDRIKARLVHRGTGLLDQEVLESALQRIKRGSAPEP